VPAGLPPDLAAQVADALAPLRTRHRVVTVATGGLDDALRALPVKLSTMGRDLDADHAYFLAAAAAGRHAVVLLPPGPHLPPGPRPGPDPRHRSDQRHEQDPADHHDDQ
jgi:hypothetical protein